MSASDVQNSASDMPRTMRYVVLALRSVADVRACVEPWPVPLSMPEAKHMPSVEPMRNNSFH